MANTFKRQSVKITAITEGAANAVYTAHAATEAILIGMRIANKVGANEVAVSVYINDGGPDLIYLSGKGTSMPIGSALELQSGKTVLNVGDVIHAYAGLANELDITLSI